MWRSSSAPDYRLSLQSTKLGDLTLQVNDGTNDLMTQQVTGALASYKVNGESQAATSDSRTVAIAPGLTLTLLGQSATGVATNVTLAQQSSSISSALSSLVSAYNAAATELNNNRGQSGGALSGNSLVYELSSTLEHLTNYFVPGANITSLASLGVTMDKTGQMSFDSPVFSSAFTSDPAGVSSFLGGAATGGFLQTATDALNGVEDSTTGTITTATNSLQSEITSMNKQISDQQAAVNQLQANLQSQMAAADTAIAGLEQQSSFLNQMFQAEMVSGQLMSSGL